MKTPIGKNLGTYGTHGFVGKGPHFATYSALYGMDGDWIIISAPTKAILARRWKKLIGTSINRELLTRTYIFPTIEHTEVAK